MFPYWNIWAEDIIWLGLFVWAQYHVDGYALCVLSETSEACPSKLLLMLHADARQ
jgi:hypothetical protein